MDVMKRYQKRLIVVITVIFCIAGLCVAAINSNKESKISNNSKNETKENYVPIDDEAEENYVPTDEEAEEIYKMLASIDKYIFVDETTDQDIPLVFENHEKLTEKMNFTVEEKENIEKTFTAISENIVGLEIRNIENSTIVSEEYIQNADEANKSYAYQLDIEEADYIALLEDLVASGLEIACLETDTETIVYDSIEEYEEYIKENYKEKFDIVLYKDDEDTIPLIVTYIHYSPDEICFMAGDVLGEVYYYTDSIIFNFIYSLSE